MEGIIAALIMVLFFSCMAPIRKELRERGISSKVVMSLTGFTAPAWAILVIFLAFQFEYAWSLKYAVLVLMWVLLVIINIFLTVYLYRYQALTVLNAYGLGFAVLFSLLADLFIFKTAFSGISMISFALFIFGGFLISSQSRKKVDFSGQKKVLLLVALGAILNAIFFSIYKIGMLQQEHILMHVAISQAALHGTLLFYAYRPMHRYIQEKKISRKQIMLISLFLIIGVFGEGYALSELPISAVIMTTLIPMAVFAAYDSKKNELHWTPRTVAAIALILIGVFLLAIP